MSADFFIEPDIVVEFFGLAGVQDEYNIMMERKRDFCARHYLQLVEIYPEDIFANNRFSTVSEKLDILLR